VSKRERQSVIRELIAAKPVGSQEEMRALLKERGWDVTQSTLSRDLREMRLARIPTPQGPRYSSPEGSVQDGRTLLEDVLPQFFSSLDGVSELLVIKTAYAAAQPVAEAIDDAGWSEIIGTLGGENTVLVICRSPAAREKVEKRLLRITGTSVGL
jgi:transcriptional regulator of arginine metabolism